MIVYAIYVISDDGRTLLTETFQSDDDLPNPLLFGALIATIQEMTIVMTKTGSEIQVIEIEGFSYHIRSFGFFWVVLVTDVPNIPEDIIQILGLRFINEYGEILIDWDSNLEVFAPFKETLREIIETETVTDESKLINPIKRLRTGDIFILPSSLQKTALAMVSLEEASIQDLVKESGEKEDVIIKNLTVLQKMGYIGKKQKNRKATYFCTTN